jgi:putative transposase
MSLDRKRHLVHRENSKLSIVGLCEVLNIHCSGIYFKPRPEKALNLRLVLLIDEKSFEGWSGYSNIHTFQPRVHRICLLDIYEQNKNDVLTVSKMN